MTKRTPVEEAVYRLKIAGGVGLVALFLILAGAAAAYSAPAEQTYSEDHFTVANSSNGEQVVITYEVSTSIKENADKETRKAAMQSMSEVGTCANAALDEYIQSHTKQKVENVNLQEVVITCRQDGVEVENIRVAGGVV